MKKLLFILMIFPGIVFSKGDVVLKKGEFITCPLDHSLLYEVTNTIKEGQPISYKDLIKLSTGKNPRPGDIPGCEALIQSWFGTCIHTNKGWLPKACQERLKLNMTFRSIISN